MLRICALLKLNIIGTIGLGSAPLLDELSDPGISTNTEKYCRERHDHPYEEAVSLGILLSLGQRPINGCRDVADWHGVVAGCGHLAVCGRIEQVTGAIFRGITGLLIKKKGKWTSDWN